MAQIKVGDEVRAHLDANYKGKVLDIIKEKHKTWDEAISRYHSNTKWRKN